MINENIQFYIKIRHRLGVSINEIFKALKSAMPEINLSLSTVTRWFNHFKCGNEIYHGQEGMWRLYDVVTGDESWFFHRKIGSKQSNASWVAEGQSPRTVVKRYQFEPKTMFSIFFKSSGMVHLTYLESGKTKCTWMTAWSYWFGL